MKRWSIGDCLSLLTISAHNCIVFLLYIKIPLYENVDIRFSDIYATCFEKIFSSSSRIIHIK
jgi:hypothetical protein